MAMKEVSKHHWPRLLYWSDVPVSPTGAGAILIYRLLEQWPADKLMVCTPTVATDCPLAGVRKVQPPKALWPRLFTSRVAFQWMTLRTLQNMLMTKLRGGSPARPLAAAFDAFAPEAVLTVGAAGAWIWAHSYARARNIPFHLIVHDDHHYAFFWIKELKAYGERLFGRAYRDAVSRLCVSAPMEWAYRKRFGVAGEVLLPSRGRDSVFFRQPRDPDGGVLAEAKVFYAGSVYGDTFKVMEDMARALRARGHRLIVYSPNRPPADLKLQHLEVRPPVPSADLVKALHEEADVMLLLTNFDQRNREAVQTLFPSKLVDYTGAAVAILVVAPEDACITAYLRERPKAARWLGDDSPEAVAREVDRLARDPALRRELAEGAVEAGLLDFDYAKVFGRFSQALDRRSGAAKPQ